MNTGFWPFLKNAHKNVILTPTQAGGIISRCTIGDHSSKKLSQDDNVSKHFSKMAKAVSEVSVKSGLDQFKRVRHGHAFLNAVQNGFAP